MKKLMILNFLAICCLNSPITQLAHSANDLLKLAGVEIYAWDSERKLKVEQFDLTVLDSLKEEFKVNQKSYEVVLVHDEKIWLHRGKDTVIAAFDKDGEILQYSGLLKVKEEGQSEAKEQMVDLVKARQ